MSSFCGGTGSAPSFTPSELREQFPGGIMQAIGTPANPDSSGLVDESWIQQTIQTLETSGIIPKPTPASKTVSTPYDSPEATDPLATYVSKDRSLQDKIKSEYCFYERRYFSALDSFLQSVSDSSMKGKAVDVNAKLDIVKQLNRTLNIFTQIVNGISKHRYSKNVQFQTDINNINGNLRDRKVKLDEQSAILNKETASVDLYKRMVNYTLEKNNANQNLLTLYGVLNIVALACIVYIART
jgi:hypothetical protein